jgi:hypothetical protein
MTSPAGRATITQACLAALGDLGGQASSAGVHQWLILHGQPMRIQQVRGGLVALSALRPPLAVCVARSRAGRGQPGQWRLTTPGRARAARLAPGAGDQ